MANEVRRVRTVFRYAEQNQLIALPVRFGSEFKQPARKVLRLERAKKGPRMFEAAELRAILDKAAYAATKAMILWRSIVGSATATSPICRSRPST